MSRHTPSGRRLRSIVAATSGLAIGIAGLGAATLPAAAAAPPDEPSAAAVSAGSSHAVTLITGDRVKVTDLSDGTHTVDIETAAPGAGIRTYEVDGDLHVIPDAAMPFLASGALDRDLFNVTMLIEYGYDDASVTATPIIVEQSSARAYAAPLPGLEVQAELPSIDGAAATLVHADSAAAWEALTASSARAFSTQPSLAGGIEAIHLDGKVRASLDASVGYIDAPEAWALGYTGDDVTVAVLDTGYDDTHPDLQGRVSDASKSFVPGEEVAWDPNGHGTHVASTIAGTGAASGGTHRGVADSHLLVGKVLGADGYGQDSWIIEAMEWAGQNAPIVSMSLGSMGGSDGKDLMAESLNQIADETGALFVVAAGNSGAPETVGSPGSAERALTVGSVDDPSGELSYFSSQGPLPRSGAMKPDLTGPGSDVTAARSADSPGEGPYVGMSGTSMATPHVAGAAAILKDRHPEYTAAQLKAALASTVQEGGYTPYQGGTGVIDVDAALEAPVIASGSGDFGMLMWGEDPTPVERTVEYTNRTDAEVTVSLAATLNDTTPGAGGGEPLPMSAESPFDAMAMDVDTLTIPAGETAAVTLTVDPAKVPAGTQLSGMLVGSVDGEPVTRTALGTIAEAERYDLTITATDFEGESATTYAFLWDATNKWAEPVLVEGETTLRLMKGDYTVVAWMDLDRTADTVASVFVGDPKLTLTENATVALDARTAKQITLDVGRDDLEQVFARMDVQSDDFTASAMMPVVVDEMWAQPMTVDDAEFDFTTRWRLWEPMLTVKAGKQPLDIILQVGSTFLNGEIKATAVDAGNGTADDFAAVDVKGKVAVVTRSGEVTPGQAVAGAAAAGAKLVILANDSDGELSTWVGSDDYESDAPIAVAAISGVDGRKLLGDMAEKKVTVTAVGDEYADVVYDIARYSEGEIPADLAYAPRDLTRIDTTYHGQSEMLGEFRYDFVPGAQYGSGYFMRAERGTVREEWVNTENLRWTQGVGVESVRWEMRDILRTYEPGDRLEVEYFGGIVRPYVGLGYWVPYRVSDYAQINVPSWADGGDAMHTGAFDTYMEPATVQQLTDIYIDGELIKQTQYQGANVWDLPDGEQEWRVVSTATHDGAHLEGSTKTVSDWTFRSAGQLGTWENRLLPMIQAYYDVEVGIDNRVGEGRKKGTSVALGLELGHVAGTVPAGAITEAKLEARTAGGEWKAISLTPAATDAPSGAVEGDGDIFVKSRAWVSGFSAQVPVSDKGGWVDLRVTAKDAAGNTFSQEIEKAFEVTPVKKR